MVATQRPPGDPCTMVLFGARGDLTKRLIIPSLYNLSRSGLLPDTFELMGVDHGDQTSEGWRDGLLTSLRSYTQKADSEAKIATVDVSAWEKLASKMTYVKGGFEDDELYGRLSARLATKKNILFYLAVADRFFGPIIDKLGDALLAKVDQSSASTPYWRRVVIEKPFGHSLQSAIDLKSRIKKHLADDQIYLIDHFLGKNIVQNIVALRFANGIFEPIWNRDHIDHVQITVSETIGVETRGRFYESTGALRDMVPNHVFNLISLIAMEAPIGFDPSSLNRKKEEVFRAMPAARPNKAVRGQYGEGTLNGNSVIAYRNEPNVGRDSKVETYVAMKLEIDNWRWAGVPFYLRTGKHMSKRLTEIAIAFKQAPFTLFRDTPVANLEPNYLTLQIAPTEGISLQFEVRRPGPFLELAPVRMDFLYDKWFPSEPNVGYETLLYDVMTGDLSLFMSPDIVEQCWRVVEPVVDYFEKSDTEPEAYASGSAGPDAADALIQFGTGRKWRKL